MPSALRSDVENQFQNYCEIADQYGDRNDYDQRIYLSASDHKTEPDRYLIVSTPEQESAVIQGGEAVLHLAWSRAVGSVIPFPRYKDSARESVEQIVGDSSSALTHKSVSFKPDIPHKQLDGALRAIAPELNGRDILFLYDDSWFNRGKNGFILTPSSIHWKERMEKSDALGYRDITTFSIKRGAGTWDTLFLNNKPIFNSAKLKDRALFNSIVDLVWELKLRWENKTEAGESRPGDQQPDLFWITRTAGYLVFHCMTCLKRHPVFSRWFDNPETLSRQLMSTDLNHEKQGAFGATKDIWPVWAFYCSHCGKKNLVASNGSDAVMLKN